MGKRKNALLSDSGRREKVRGPGDAFRRQQKKKEGIRRKEQRTELRLLRQVRQDPEGMRRKLDRMEVAGSAGKREQDRMELARSLLDRHAADAEAPARAAASRVQMLDAYGRVMVQDERPAQPEPPAELVFPPPPPPREEEAAPPAAARALPDAAAEPQRHAAPEPEVIAGAAVQYPDSGAKRYRAASMNWNTSAMMSMVPAAVLRRRGAAAAAKREEEGRADAQPEVTGSINLAPDVDTDSSEEGSGEAGAPAPAVSARRSLFFDPAAKASWRGEVAPTPAAAPAAAAAADEEDDAKLAAFLAEVKAMPGV
eukprot:TRINITY_DN11837_c0_g1_i1.p2 TRINITY_DN11837_c0_g1~~TRINITY_DN11837_c0_g1_i1.p2  ORF type:complete len:312 (+),score=110.97 TRINITY_DN11837_c0_g1_i1:92-1027(+)